MKNSRLQTTNQRKPSPFRLDRVRVSDLEEKVEKVDQSVKENRTVCRNSGTLEENFPKLWNETAINVLEEYKTPNIQDKK